jgi:hypothetical protein
VIVPAPGPPPQAVKIPATNERTIALAYRMVLPSFLSCAGFMSLLGTKRTIADLQGFINK